MRTEIIFASIALVLSLVSIMVTLLFSMRQIRTTGLLASIAAMIQVEKSLADVPSALKFHGISVDDLRRDGIEPDEFVYLLTNLTAGAVYHRTILRADYDVFSEGKYRHIMCSQPATQRAWQYIKPMMGDHVFTKKMDETIRTIEGKRLNCLT